MLGHQSHRRQSKERLLQPVDETELMFMSSKDTAIVTLEQSDGTTPGPSNFVPPNQNILGLDQLPCSPIVYRVYKRRFFGLCQLVLLNIVVSWDVGYILLSCPRNSR